MLPKSQYNSNSSRYLTALLLQIFNTDTHICDIHPMLGFTIGPLEHKYCSTMFSIPFCLPQLARTFFEDEYPTRRSPCFSIFHMTTQRIEPRHGLVFPLSQRFHCRYQPQQPRRQKKSPKMTKELLVASSLHCIFCNCSTSS